MPSGKNFVNLLDFPFYDYNTRMILPVPKGSVSPFPVSSHSRERYFFPFYGHKFVLETDIGEITTEINGAQYGWDGHPEATEYISTDIRHWYSHHRELKDGDALRMYSLEPWERYELEILK